jgi:protein-tyrosine phosphatase
MDHASVLLVCMGNICRSPMADAVLRHLVDEAGLADRVRVDSAGTHSYHLGNEPHPETQAELTRRGVDVGDQRSRLVTPADLASFDFVVAMDHANMGELRALAQEAGGVDAVHAELSLLLDHTDEADVDEVPDPYYVGGYDRVYELVDAGCRGLLDTVRATLD